MGKTNEAAQPQQEATMAKKYKLKALPGGAVSVKHRIIGDITNDHIQGPNGADFIKAIKNCDADGTTKGFFDAFIEEVK